MSSSETGTLRGQGTSRDPAPAGALNANGKRTLSTVSESVKNNNMTGSSSSTVAAGQATNGTGDAGIAESYIQARTLGDGGEKSDIVMDDGEAAGHSWKNQKAQMDMAMAWDHIVDKELAIGSKVSATS